MTTSSQRRRPKRVSCDRPSPSLGVPGKLGAADGGLGAARMREWYVQHSMPIVDPTRDPISVAKEAVETRAATTCTVRLVCATSSRIVTTATASVPSVSLTERRFTSTSAAAGMSCRVALRIEM